MNMHRQLHNVPVSTFRTGLYQEPIVPEPIAPRPSEASIDTENPVNSKTAIEQIGWSETMMSAVKKAMGIKGRYFFLSDVRKFIREHPDFRIRDVYPRWETKPRGNRQSPQPETADVHQKGDA